MGSEATASLQSEEQEQVGGGGLLVGRACVSVCVCLLSPPHQHDLSKGRYLIPIHLSMSHIFLQTIDLQLDNTISYKNVSLFWQCFGTLSHGGAVWGGSPSSSSSGESAPSRTPLSRCVIFILLLFLWRKEKKKYGCPLVHTEELTVKLNMEREAPAADGTFSVPLL